MPTDTAESREKSPTREANPPSSASDTDGGERTTRHQLKKASIAGIPIEPNGASSETAETDRNSNNLRRKRSADDVDGQEDEPEAPRTEKPIHHTRKRSRDDAYERSKAAEESVRKTPPSEEAAAQATSPKGKRDFKQLDSVDEPDAKRHRENLPKADDEENKDTVSSAGDSDGPARSDVGSKAGDATKATGDDEKPTEDKTTKVSFHIMAINSCYLTSADCILERLCQCLCNISVRRSGRQVFFIQRICELRIWEAFRIEPISIWIVRWRCIEESIRFRWRFDQLSIRVCGCYSF
jgi:hypothetical protein